MLSARAALCLALAGSGTALGAPAHWRVLLWSEPVVVSVDTGSITARAERITARVMWDYAQPRSTRDSRTASYKSMIGLMVFDCATDRVGGAGGVSYSGDDGGGTAVAQFAISPEQAPLSATLPGTLGRDLTDLVCSRAKQNAALGHPPPVTQPAG
jgi:hypothetical protein